MSNERLILCGGADASNAPFGDPRPVALQFTTPNKNVNLEIEVISKHVLQRVPDRFVDLIEIATYVYCADQAVTRGGEDLKNLGGNWRRRLFFRIPVRDLDFWSSSEVTGVLAETLGFLSEDEYLFDFIPLKSGSKVQDYLPFAKEDISLGHPDSIIMFSGGLDSLGGAVQEAVLDQRNVFLVHHRPTSKIQKRHGFLLRAYSNRRYCGILL